MIHIEVMTTHLIGLYNTLMEDEEEAGDSGRLRTTRWREM